MPPLSEFFSMQWAAKSLVRQWDGVKWNSAGTLERDVSHPPSLEWSCQVWACSDQKRKSAWLMGCGLIQGLLVLKTVKRGVVSGVIIHSRPCNLCIQLLSPCHTFLTPEWTLWRSKIDRLKARSLENFRKIKNLCFGFCCCLVGNIINIRATLDIF